MKTLKTTIQKNIWVTIDEVCVTVVVTAKRMVILNERFLSAKGRAFVMQQVKNLKPQAIIFSKQRKQVNRTMKNQTKATRMSIKQEVNRNINDRNKNNKLTKNVRDYLNNKDLAFIKTI